MDNIQTEFNNDDIRNIVEEGVIENVQYQDDNSGELGSPVE